MTFNSEDADKLWTEVFKFDERGKPLVCSQATAKEQDQFCNGFCHTFALALHEYYGWQLRALGHPNEIGWKHSWNGLSYLPKHLYCLREDGRPTDIHGVFANEEAIRRFFLSKDALNEPQISVDTNQSQIMDLPNLGYPRIFEDDLKYAKKVIERLALDKLSISAPDYGLEI